MIFESLATRRRLLLAGASLAVTGCSRRQAAKPSPAKSAAASAPAAAPVRGTLEWAVAGPWRQADARRDAAQHPLQTLGFFGLKPGMTVVEVWPGAGWYSQIIAPYLTATGGKLYAATFEVAGKGDTAAAEVVSAYRKLIAGRPDLYGAVQFTRFGPASGPLAPAGAADLVLFLNTLHSWMAAGLAEKAFRDAYAALKPGGVLGVEAHRAEPGGPQDPLASNGYVQEAYVKQLAQEAGFRFDHESEVNANPKDTKDHPFGVWTLPPDRRSAKDAGSNPKFDHRRYDAIGESDRMTLRFVKPT